MSRCDRMTMIGVLTTVKGVMPDSEVLEELVGLDKGVELVDLLEKRVFVIVVIVVVCLLGSGWDQTRETDALFLRRYLWSLLGMAERL